MADWAKLQKDVLYEIGKRITVFESYGSFSSVCRSWRAAVPRDKQHLKLKTFGSPIIMLPQRNSSTDIREFFIFSSKKTFSFFLPEASQKYCLLCKEWLFIVEKDGIHASLLHVLSRVQIHLPAFSSTFRTLHNYIFWETVVLSADPNSNSGFIVMVLCLNEHYFYKSGNSSWSAIAKWYGIIRLAIYHNNYLYALDNSFSVIRCDVNGPNPQWQQISDSLPKLTTLQLDSSFFVTAVYMVEFSKNLFVVRRYIEYQMGPRNTTKRYEVYEVKKDDHDGGKWVEIKNLGNKSIFLGYNSSFVIECSDNNNCKPNCIYFLNSLYNGGEGKDTGIYHLSDGTINPFL